jgi:WD40 repeat protein
MRKFEGHNSQIVTILFQADSSLQPANVELEHTSPAYAKSPNILLSASFDGICRVWDTRQGDTPIRELAISDKCPPWATSVTYPESYIARR